MRAFGGIAAGIALLGAGGMSCGEFSQDDVETVVSAVGNFPSFVRAYNRSDGVHSFVFRDNTGTITEGASFLQQVGGLHGGAPWAYKRHDSNNTNAIIYVANNQHVHEITNTGGSNFADTDFVDPQITSPVAPLASAGPLGGPMPDVIGYVRTDGVNAMVYRSSDDHVIEIESNFGHSPAWGVSDLTTITGGPTVLKGSAFPYIRSDNRNAIVYVASDSHIHEICSTFPTAPGWEDNDLYVHSGESAVPSTDPWAYKRSDPAGVNAVVFVGTDNALHELSLTPGTLCWTGKEWCAGPIAAATLPTGGLSARPSGFVRTDSKNSVIYVSNGGTQLREVRLEPAGWTDTNLPLNGFSPSQPFGCTGPANSLFYPSGGTRNYVTYEGKKIGVGPDGFQLSLPQNGSGSWDLAEFHACPGC